MANCRDNICSFFYLAKYISSELLKRVYKNYHEEQQLKMSAI